MDNQLDLEEVIKDIESVVESVDAKAVVDNAIKESKEKGIYLVHCRVSWRKKRGSKSTIGYAKGNAKMPIQLVTINPTSPLSDPVALDAVRKHLGLTEGKYQDLCIETIYLSKQVGERSKQAIQQDEEDYGKY